MSELVIRNGNVYLGNGSWHAGGLVLKHGLVKHLLEPQAVVAPGARTLDAQGGSILPGFQDARVRVGSSTHHILTLQAEHHAAGVTAWTTPLEGTLLQVQQTVHRYLSLADEGSLLSDVALVLPWDISMEQQQQLRAFRSLRDKAATANGVRAAAVRIDLHAIGSVPRVKRAALTETMFALDGAGFDLHLEVVDAAELREALAMLTRVRRGGGGAGRRHQIVAIGEVMPEPRRLKSLETTLSLPLPSNEHEQRMPDAALRALLENEDIRVAAASGAGPRRDPLHAISVASAFEGVGGAGIGDLLDTYLSGAAWANRFDGYAGLIAPLMRGDVIVLDQDLQRDPERIATTCVTHTFVAGEAVFTSIDRAEATRRTLAAAS